MTQFPGDGGAQRALDQQVAAIIRASGGWNPQARARLAQLAAARRIDPMAVAASARRIAAAGLDPAAGAGAGASDAAPLAAFEPLASERAPGRFDDPASVRAPVARRAASPTVALAIGVGCVAVGAIASGVLVWFALRVASTPVATKSDDRSAAPAPAPEPAPEPAPRTTRPAPPAPAERTASAPTPAPAPTAPAPTTPTTPTTPPARDIPPAAAVYSRPPVLRTDGFPGWSRTALESIAADEAALEELDARLATGEAATDADRALWSRAAQALTAAWPQLDARRRDEALVHLAGSFARLGDESARDALRAPLQRMIASQENGPEALVRTAGAAGILACVELRAAGGAPEAFAAAAMQRAGPHGDEIAAAALSGDSARTADLVEAWLGALDAVAAQPARRLERDARILLAIEGLLRRNAPLERPGVASDTVGSLLDALPWTGDAPRRTRLAEGIRAWMLDPTIAPMPLHGMTSILAARRPGTWWEPWLVSAPRADAGSRARTGQRFVEAMARGEASPAPATADGAPARRVKGVPTELVERWAKAADAVTARSAPTDPAARLARCAEEIALVESLRLLERGRLSDAQARMAQVEDPTGLAPDQLDRWRDRTERTPVRPASTDGTLGEELRARRSLQDRLAALRLLRTRVAGDLGPADAAVLAREALASPTPELRSVAQGVIVDAYALGPEVIAALAAEVSSAVSAGEAAQLAALVSGQPVPRGSDERLRSAAALLLLDHLASLTPSDRNRIDSVAREFTLSANAAVRALGGSLPGTGATPEAAFAAWFAARVNDARPLVPAPTIEAVEQRAQARRRLAQPGPQRFVAESTSLLDLEGTLLAERSPRRRAEVDACLQRASAARARAGDVYAQVEANARALLELARLGIEQDGGVR
ncbi:MAG: hypothetical protein U0625_06100 [Phycisphaerales bacterium]